jgi:hypothetical protein
VYSRYRAGGPASKAKRKKIIAILEAGKAVDDDGAACKTSEKESLVAMSPQRRKKGFLRFRLQAGC